MRTAKLNPRPPKTWIRGPLYLLTATLLLSGCGDTDGMPLVLDTFRCPEQGLCMYATGKKSMQGGYREGNEELRFDVLYRPYRGLTIGAIYPWCMRLVDHKNQEYFSHDNGHCPASWYSKEGLQRIAGQESYLAAFRRDDLARALSNDLQAASAPRKRDAAMGVLRDMVDTHMLAAANPGKSANLVQRSRDAARISEGSVDSRSKTISPPEVSPETGLSLPLSILPEEASGEELTNTEDEIPDEDEWPLMAPQDSSDVVTGVRDRSSAATYASIGRIAALSKGAKDGVPRKSPEAVIEDPGFEFKQTLTLYSQNVKSHLFFGKRTRKHHTAAKILVFKRPRGTNQPWVEVDHALTANHGSSPLSRDMKPYDWCEDTPVTYGRTVWMGECHGSWGIGDRKHLCNDDTRLQIRNAYNIASNKRCEKLDHYHRPWCAKR